jgi:magnesium chelatase family protein
MFAQVTTVAFEGIEAKPVDVQVQITAGLPSFNLVGLPDKAVAESRERVRGALAAIGLALPPKRITINLAPADLPKEGSHYDLPIALGLMAACGAVAPDAIAGYCVIGELSLDGSITRVAGALPAAIGANALDKGLICPEGCGPEAAWASRDMDLLAPPNLLALINHFKGLQTLPRPEPALEAEPEALPDMGDIKGQESARRALEVAAAGGHNFLMIGPPGAGKSMLARRLPSILPPLTAEELLEVSMVHSMAGALSGGQSGRARPFRSPHHSASMAALVGGGTKPKPGEAALAHLGVLFLDELPEFSPQALDALRQPLESGETIIARANHRILYPSRIQLVAAMNPCRCGRANEPGFACSQGRHCADRYQSRVSGPLLDRIDMQIEVPTVTAADLIMPSNAEGSEAVRARVIAAREIQTRRYAALGQKGVRTNSDCAGPQLEEIAAPDKAGMALLHEAAVTLKLSARGYHRTLRVARTLADLDGVQPVARIHIAEALSYRGETLKRQIAA